MLRARRSWGVQHWGAASWGFLALGLSALAGAGGCTSLAPDYHRPSAPVPAQWPDTPDGTLQAGTAMGTSGADHRTAQARQTTADGSQARLPVLGVFVQDARLLRLMSRAQRKNRSLRMMLAAVLAARARYSAQSASRWPAVQGGAQATLGRNVNPAFGSNAFMQQRYQVGLDLPSFELDLFGRLRNLSRAAQAQLLASAHAARAARLAVSGELAERWIALAADRSRLALAEKTAASAAQSVSLTERRLHGGVASRVDVRQAETTYYGALADVANYTALVGQDQNALQLVVGEPVGQASLPASLPAAGGWFADVPVGLPSEVLLERPDVQEAEAQLVAAHAQIGAARAAYFPTLSLTAAAGLASTSLAALLRGGTPVWSVSPALSVPIFNAGLVDAQVEETLAERQRLLAAYELAIQTAFKEVADALARRATLQAEVTARRQQVESARDGFTLAEARYRRGVDGYLQTLDAQRVLYTAQQQWIDTRQAQLLNQVTLYRALGGGVPQTLARSPDGQGEASGSDAPAP